MNKQKPKKENDVSKNKLNRCDIVVLLGARNKDTRKELY